MKPHEHYLNLIKSDIESTKKDFQSARDYIKNSSAVFSRGELAFLAVPKMFSSEEFAYIEKTINTMREILEKVMDRYIEDDNYRKLFDFPSHLEELILADCGYERKIPIARLDFFFNHDEMTLKYCEFNTDGSSAMNEDREIVNAWRNSLIWGKFQDKYEIKSFELFDSWVNEFLELYSDFCKKSNSMLDILPRVAIVDFLDIGTKSEFKVFKEAFERQGMETIIEDIRNLKYRDGRLHCSLGLPIDAIYRRAVTSECMDKFDDIQDCIKAFKDKAVCLIGAFRTQIPHDKIIFKVLQVSQTRAFLTKEENEFIEKCIPKTYELKTGEFDLRDVLENKNSYLIKPRDRYASIGVATGGDYEKDEWEKLITKALDKDFILQEYCTPPQHENVYFDKEGSAHFGIYNSMSGIFLYNNKPCGIYTRAMQGKITTPERQGRIPCSVLVKLSSTDLSKK
ncbi:MAG: glutathionylspermidine synthase family protein [Firmicutes bacterium]|nr:glutathionylspermidine synthase family protein [Bacillota bacterium]